MIELLKEWTSTQNGTIGVIIALVIICGALVGIAQAIFKNGCSECDCDCDED